VQLRDPTFAKQLIATVPDSDKKQQVQTAISHPMASDARRILQD
jgi:hypothetical protein